MAESVGMNSPMRVGAMCQAAPTASVQQLAQPSLKKSPLRLLLRETQSPFV
jgi:hypothetical protein